MGAEHSLEDVIDLEQEALAETGNIILNACLATIANVLRRTMRMSLPSVIRGDGDALFDVKRGEAAIWCCFSTSTSRSRIATSMASSLC